MSSNYLAVKNIGQFWYLYRRYHTDRPFDSLIVKKVITIDLTAHILSLNENCMHVVIFLYFIITTSESILKETWFLTFNLLTLSKSIPGDKEFSILWQWKKKLCKCWSWKDQEVHLCCYCHCHLYTCTTIIVQNREQIL